MDVGEGGLGMWLKEGGDGGAVGRGVWRGVGQAIGGAGASQAPTCRGGNSHRECNGMSITASLQTKQTRSAFL